MNDKYTDQTKENNFEQKEKETLMKLYHNNIQTRVPSLAWKRW